MTVQYSKDREAGGFSVYAKSYGEGLMLFTYDKERNMIPVWIRRFVANQIRKSVEYAEKHYWHIPVWRFIFFDEVWDYYTPVDAYCPDCGKRVISGLKKIDEQDTIYYASCASCGFNLETYPGDYEIEMNRFIKDTLVRDDDK